MKHFPRTFKQKEAAATPQRKLYFTDWVWDPARETEGFAGGSLVRATPAKAEMRGLSQIQEDPTGSRAAAHVPHCTEPVL